MLSRTTIFRNNATPIIPSLKIRGNKIYGIAQEDHTIVRTVDDMSKL